MDNEYYIYEYIRLDYNEPFYIGKGKGNRWKDKKNRSVYFNNICNHTQVAVNIVEDGLSAKEAYLKECWYIWKLRDVDGYNLVNKTDGGEGGNTLVLMSEKDLANYKARMSIKLKGRVFTKEHKEKIGNSLKGRFFSEETRKKIRESKVGIKYTEERKKEISIMTSGENNPMFGKKQSDNTKRLISEKNTKKVVLIDRDGNIIKEFNSSMEMRNGEWRLEFPSPNGINHVGSCLTKGLDFHGHKLIYK